MGVYIKNVEMPRNCLECKLAIYDDIWDKVCPFNPTIPALNIGILKDCPLVEVKAPHGDLIDRDGLEEKVDAYGVSYSNLKNAQTIIEAEG